MIEEQIRAIVRDEIAKSKAPTPNTEPDPGEGWRLLDKEEPVIAGDEFFSGDVWQKSCNHTTHGKQGPLFRYRRRIEPKYREPTNADIGQMVEVRHAFEVETWSPGKLVCVLDDSYDECYVVEMTGDYFTWGEARIQEPTK